MYCFCFDIREWVVSESFISFEGIFGFAMYESRGQEKCSYEEDNDRTSGYMYVILHRYFRVLALRSKLFDIGEHPDPIDCVTS